MAVIDALANLQELQVVLHSLLVLLDVVVEHSDRVVRPALVSYLPCPSAPKSQHLVILQSPHHSDVSTIIYLLLEFVGVLKSSLVEHGGLFGDPGGSIEEKRQLYSVRLRGRHRPVVALLVETPHVVLFGERPSDFEGLVDVALVAAVASFGPAVHNKNINPEVGV